MNFDQAVLSEAARLKELAAEATKIAAYHRERKNYAIAETFDRRAEALSCAAVLVETRGLSL